MLLGVMPLRDFHHAEYLQHEVPGMPSLPEALLERMYTAREESSETGQAIARELIQRAHSGGLLRGRRAVIGSRRRHRAERAGPGGDVIATATDGDGDDRRRTPAQVG